MEWKEVRLGDIADVQTGPFGSQLHKSDYIAEGIPCIMPTNIGPHLNLVVDGIAHVSEVDANRLSRHLTEFGDIIYARRGDIEKCAYVTTNEEKWLCGTGCLKIRCKNEVNSRFIAYLLSTAECKKWITGNAVGTTMLNLSKGILSNLPLIIPSLVDQRRIASVLSSLDRKIELNNKINADLEEMAQAIFKNWFVDFEPFKDGKFVNSELGMIPEGWKVGRLDEIADIVGGSTPSKAKPEYYTQKGIAWLTPKDLSNHPAVYSSRGEIDITQEGYNSTSTKLMPKGTVLFTSRAPIGYISIAQNDICTNQGFKSLVPKKAGTCFLYCFLKYVTPEIENKSTGSTFKEASGALMKSLQVIIPEQNVFEDFESITLPLFTRIESLEKESSRLSLLRDTLLPRLMSGEIEIPE